MSDDFDLETGDPDRAERLQAEGKAARGARAEARKPRTGTTKKTTTTKRQDPDVTLVTRITQAFKDLAKQAESRNDTELADILDRRAEAMAHGLESMTRSVKWLRGPLIFFLAFLEPALAFWELGSLFTTRYVNRRARKAAERQYREQGIEIVDGVVQ